MIGLLSLFLFFGPNSMGYLFENKNLRCSGTKNWDSSSISQLLPANKMTELNIIFLFTNYDCSSCVEDAADICNSYCQIYSSGISVFAVNRSDDDIGLMLHEGIIPVIDTNDVLRKSLEYSYTPKIILLDSNYRLLYCFDVNIDKNKLLINSDIMRRIIRDEARVE